ncbi:MAG: bifunctional phosphopantothenoylcysteine decarboxylase/phosphopantothenate--cysteine ligase CoaBC [Nitrospira sp. SB0677_bin_15]|nr:bifunctional phosphopantothenoylcysteine decarboxylase/phosphopantothenate--cysteine ligase CoaBC [Nitrospira sp. SB0677_bin_15]
MVLCVTGSIAAYKAVPLLRTLVDDGAQVSVVMTPSATQFVSPLTFEVLSGRPVLQRLFAGDQPMPHLRATKDADLVLVAPATANSLAKCALGLADDLLGTLFVSARCPVVMAPAMDVEMWGHPAVAAHTRTLREHGVVVLEPEEGSLASGLTGKGRLPAEHVILDAVRSRLALQRDWSGQRVLVSAGPTREPIDAVRFITNASSGKMGYAMAKAAAQRGAEVVLVSGPTALPAPPNVTCVPVLTAEEMHQELEARFAWATVLVMTAAVGDFRPRRPSSEKIKKHEWTGEPLELERTPDILQALSRKRTHHVLVGFAAESGSLLDNGRKKLHQKDLDLLVVNRITGPQSAFGNETNEVILLPRHGTPIEVERLPKRVLADRILDTIREQCISASSKTEAPWMAGFGGLSDLSDENRRILTVIEQEFETLSPEDLR